MAVNRNQMTRVADLEATQAREQYTPPMIITYVVNPDRSCDRVMVRSGLFKGHEFSRETNETSTAFEARADREIDLMDQEADAGGQS